MSFRPEQFLRNKGRSFNTGEGFLEEKSEGEIQDIFLEVLHSRVHGFCFSPYVEGQKPGDILTEAQIRRRIEKLKTGLLEGLAKAPPQVPSSHTLLGRQYWRVRSTCVGSSVD